MLKLVKQKDEYGCVPACIATLANISYEKAKKILHPRSHKWNDIGVQEKITFKALTKLGFKYRDRKWIISIKEIRNNSIIVVDHSVYGDGAHAVIWDSKKQKVLDPYVCKTRSLKKSLTTKRYDEAAICIYEILSRKYNNLSNSPKK